MDAAKFKKLEEYASTLGRKGAEEEKNHEYAEAIGTYLKLVDVLLVMADATPNYPYWLKCTTSAETYQKKIKSLIAIAALKQEKEQAGTRSVPQVSQSCATKPAAAILTKHS